MLDDRQIANAHAGRDEDGVGDGWRDRRDAGLAAAAQGRVAVVEMDFDVGAVGETRHRIIRKIRLRDGAFVDSDFSVLRCAQAEETADEAANAATRATPAKNPILLICFLRVVSRDVLAQACLPMTWSSNRAGQIVAAKTCLPKTCLPKTCAPPEYNGAQHKRSLFPTDLRRQYRIP